MYIHHLLLICWSLSIIMYTAAHTKMFSSVNSILLTVQDNKCKHSHWTWICPFSIGYCPFKDKGCISGLFWSTYWKKIHFVLQLHVTNLRRASETDRNLVHTTWSAPFSSYFQAVKSILHPHLFLMGRFLPDSVYQENGGKGHLLRVKASPGSFYP